MKRILLYLALFIVALGLIAPGASAKWWRQQKTVKVMTRNLYLGADIFPVIQVGLEDPSLIPAAVSRVYHTVLYTNFEARAEAIADEIARKKPHVVGLQEVSTYYKQTPGDFLVVDQILGMVPNPDQTPATEVFIDFYAVLDAALRDRGLRYKAFTVTNAEVELPMADSDEDGNLIFSDLRLVDHDVILVRRGIPAWEVLADNYEYNLGVDLSLGSVEFTRGFVIVDAIIKGRIFRFVNTHLEVRDDPDSIARFYQSAQMYELLGTLDYLEDQPFLGNRPIIMLGDFNSSEDDVPGETEYTDEDGNVIPLEYIPPYMQAIHAGYLDAWLEQKTYDEGFTSGFQEWIDDPADTLDTRIDLIFLDPAYLAIEKVKCKVVGDDPSVMVPNPLGDALWPPDMIPKPSGDFLWPSDHAGVFAKIKFSTPYRPWWLRLRWCPK
jgi:endonuclease/exonuclease/phosphatase family metal-dependent hydrolase